MLTIVATDADDFAGTRNPCTSGIDQLGTSSKRIIEFQFSHRKPIVRLVTGTRAVVAAWLLRVSIRNFVSIERAQLFRSVIPIYKDSSRRRQRAKESCAVSLGHDPGIRNHNCTPVRARSNQPAKALLQPQRCMRHHVFAERIAATFRNGLAVRSRDRLRRYPKRKLGDQKSAQRVPGDIHTLPIRGCAQKNSATRFAKLRKQRIARLFTMNEKGTLDRHAAAPELCRRLPHIAMTREQHEDSAVRCAGEIVDHPHDGPEVSGRICIWSGRVLRNRKNCLTREVEWRLERLSYRRNGQLIQAEPPGEKFES